MSVKLSRFYGFDLAIQCFDFFYSAWEIMEEAFEYDDGRPDFAERKYCNYMTTTYENCTNIIHDCFPQEEINFWIDNDLSNYMDGIEEIYTNWNSQKCPPFR